MNLGFVFLFLVSFKRMREGNDRHPFLKKVHLYMVPVVRFMDGMDALIVDLYDRMADTKHTESLSLPPSVCL